MNDADYTHRQLSPPYVVELVDDHGNTADNRAKLGRALQERGVRVEAFARQIAGALGFQPVISAARRQWPDGRTDLAETAYLGRLLDWGVENAAMFRRVLYLAFDDLEAPMAEQAGRNRANNCTTVVDMVRVAQSFLLQHPSEPAFAHYLTKPPTPVPITRATGVGAVRVPRYDVHRLLDATDAGHGITDRRKRAMQRGFERMERLQTAMIYIKHIGTELETARRAVASMPQPQRAIVTQHLQATGNGLLAYLCAGGRAPALRA